jgi:hypothetical protein
MLAPWERQPGEPARWYARFTIYLELGIHRTLQRAYRIVGLVEERPGKQPGAAWYQMARKWQWRARAAAWDAAERERLRGIEQERRFDAREVRLKMIDELLAGVYFVLLSADLPEMKIEEARARLPTLRLFFRDLLAAQRAELGLPALADDDDAGIDSFTADEYSVAQRAIVEWLRRRRLGNYRQEFYLLRNLLATLYPNPETAQTIAQQAGVAGDLVSSERGPVENWHAVLAAAEEFQREDALVMAVHGHLDCPAELVEALRTYKSGDDKVRA